MPQTCWRYWKNPYLFTPPNFGWWVSGRHHEMRGKIIGSQLLSRLGSEVRSFEWRHQNSGRVRVYNFWVAVVIEEPRLSSNCFCNTTVENTTDRFNIGHHRISSKFEAGKRSLCYIFIACATGIADNNGCSPGQPHGEQLVQYPPLQHPQSQRH